MANEEHLAILRKGVDKWNKWRSQNHDIIPDLFNADLHDANLVLFDFDLADLGNANLYAANLAGANLSHAHLNGAILSHSDLRNADLNSTNLNGAELNLADLTSANLRGVFARGADFSGANLNSVNLTMADLTNAKLAAANLPGTIFYKTIATETEFAGALCASAQFINIDLSTARGLETIRHGGPSSIGIDTLYNSGGNIPREFLEGCGVPESLIVFAKSLVGQAIEYYSCFISHSSQDAAFCDRLAQQMKAAKLRVWYAPEDMKGGEKVYTQIDEAIRLHDKLIIVLSEASMNSKWVRVEIQRALKREKSENRRVLFPITLVDYEALQNWELVASDGLDLAEEIREYFIADFSQWKDHDSFMVAFQRLLADLRKGE